jgi:hypothetical protein
MKQSIAVIGWVGLNLIALPVQAETYSFAAHCSLMSPGNNDFHADCQVTHTYNEARQWTHTQIQWSGGRVTEIEVETINRRPSDRVNSRFGLATVDGEHAEYSTFSDGGICFEIDRNQHAICYR